MKTTSCAWVVLAVGAGMAAVGAAAGPLQGLPAPTLMWETMTSIDLGVIDDECVREVTFGFYNTGDAPLRLDAVGRTERTAVDDTLVGAGNPIGPRIEFENRVCDLGSITDESPHECVWTFTNVGDGPLELDLRRLYSHGTVPNFDNKLRRHFPVAHGVSVQGVSGPRIVFERRRIDLGVISDEQSLVVRFPFASTGTEPVHVRARSPHGSMVPVVTGFDQFGREESE